VIVAIHLTGADLLDPARAALAALAACPGYLRGSVGRSPDEPEAWLLCAEWANVGSYRRALGAYQVKLTLTPLMAAAQDWPSAFESLVVIEPDGSVTTSESFREPTR
jgi:heme oxygenase (mycobilin-producing)